MPDDFVAALDAEPAALEMFAILTSQNRYAVLHRIETAKRPDTRRRRIEQFVAMLGRGETVYPQKRTLADSTLPILNPRQSTARTGDVPNDG